MYYLVAVSVYNYPPLSNVHVEYFFFSAESLSKTVGFDRTAVPFFSLGTDETENTLHMGRRY